MVLGSITIPMDSYRSKETIRTVKKKVHGSIMDLTELWMKNAQEPTRTV